MFAGFEAISKSIPKAGAVETAQLIEHLPIVHEAPVPHKPGVVMHACDPSIGCWRHEAQEVLFTFSSKGP